jgi:hypothetical protein
MAKYAYEIAEEILRAHCAPMHYVDITEAILRIDKSFLGKRGSTPEQTVGSMLRAKPHIFKKCGQGYYALAKRKMA